MCSIAMPGELMLAHGPYARPLFRSVATAMGQQHPATISPRSVPPLPTQSPPTPRIRPCLSRSIILGSTNGNERSKSDDDEEEDEDDDEDGDDEDDDENLVNDEDEDEDALSRRKQKRVVFADDRGRPLTQVRIMTEPSNVPPAWTGAYLANVAKGRIGGESAKSSLLSRSLEPPSSPSWEMNFIQPASDYLAFRRKLDDRAVSLENVIIRESEECLVGTIKVKNIAYDKEIVLRASTDGWSTKEDLHCSYVEQLPVARAALVLYDTFRFRFNLPIKSERVEFCVRYRVGDASGHSEYWDNNDGKNYVVRRKQHTSKNGSFVISNNGDTINNQDSKIVASRNLMNAVVSATSNVDNRESKEQQIARITDATRANMMTWSEFASWQHLNNDAPYW